MSDIPSLFICGKLKPDHSGEVCSLPPRHQRALCSWAGRLVKVPDVPLPGRCGKQKLDAPHAMTRCGFKANHSGRHSWQEFVKIGEAAERVKR